jgi:diadenosine tetraphosphatase ApaH/serine/threonine PP2A family protein phosphatase
LEAVFAEMEKSGVRRMVVLGDVVGYGPFPNDCLRMISGAEVCLQGTHEAGLVGELGEEWFNDAAWGALEWTRKKLTHADREQMSKWRPTGQFEGIELAHASLNPDAVFDYLLTPRALKVHFAAQTAPLCFVGHTHIPEIWTEGREDPVACPKSGVYRLEEGRKTVINVGSVGLPRGGDKRATWATYDPLAGEVTLRRTSYDVQEVIRTIKHLGHEPVVAAKLLRDLS